uniref:Kinetochore protein NDC80 n=1 Tax=Macrostomum lignano TaxID=282301 RepID=A0A1I8IZB1_9PLAT
MKRSGLPRPQQSDANTRRSRPHGTLTERKSSFLPSSVATPGKRQTEKDTRNLKDRTWQKAVVIRAQSFIEVVGLQALCTSSLKPGSIWTLKEIYNVLEGFVSGVIDLGQSSSFSSIPADSKQRAEQLYNKIEYLGYPYVLSSPNTPHNWPLVLGLIDYLCDKLDERKDGAAQYQRMLQRPGECGASLGDILHAMEEGYAFFLQHGKDGGHFVDRLVQPSLIRKRRDLAQAEEKARLAAEEARVWKERAVPAQRLQQELQELQERFARAEQEADRLRERRSQLESELPLKEAELAAGRTQIDRLRDECEQLSERIRAQPVSQAQVMSIRGDIKELESYIGRLDETLANTEQAIWASETQLSADHDKLSQACNQVNVRLAHLGLPQRAVPELNDDAHQSNQAIEPAREEARKRLDSIIDAVETQEARLATINSMIEAEKASKRRSEEAKLQ